MINVSLIMIQTYYKLYFCWQLLVLFLLTESKVIHNLNK